MSEAQQSADEITRLLAHMSDPQAPEHRQLIDRVYQELKRIAIHHVAGETPGATLSPTVLVHEAYLKLAAVKRMQWRDRRHFYGAAAEAMRRILVDRARRMRNAKHGGDQQRVDWDGDLAAPGKADEVLALDAALEQLSALDETMAAVVKLRFYGGQSAPEIATILDCSPRSVDRLWSAARAWLSREMTR